MLPSHNCIIVNNVQFSRYIFESLRNSMKFRLNRNFSQSLKVVEISGIEPLTSCLQGRRSPSWAKPPNISFLFCKKWWARTRFSAEKPRRLQQSTGLLPRAAFRVHFGVNHFRTQLSRSWLLFKTFLKWWAKMDSNHRPHDYQSCALASWAIGPYRLLTS